MKIRDKRRHLGVYGSRDNPIIEAGRVFIQRSAPTGKSRRLLAASIASAVRAEEARLDAFAQHGPVRILVKDGKPCSPD